MTWLRADVQGDAVFALRPNAHDRFQALYDGLWNGGVDATTLDGKVLCGYQGWHNTPGDGAGFGWTHWGQGLDKLQAGGGRFVIDMWPDVREYDPADLTDVPGLKMPDGSPARTNPSFFDALPGPTTLEGVPELVVIDHPGWPFRIGVFALWGIVFLAWRSKL